MSTLVSRSGILRALSRHQAPSNGRMLVQRAAASQAAIKANPAELQTVCSIPQAKVQAHGLRQMMLESTSNLADATIPSLLTTLDQLAHLDTEALPRSDKHLHALVSRALDLIRSSSVEDCFELMKRFASMGLRSPVRDSGVILTERFKAIEDELVSAKDFTTLTATLDTVASAVYLSGRGQIYQGELFEILSRHCSLLSDKAIATFCYEAGRHTLRTKHFVVNNIETVCERVVDMSLTDLMTVWHGLSRFPRDWPSFFKVTQARVGDCIALLSPEEITNVLRVAKELRCFDGSYHLQQAAVRELLAREDLQEVDQEEQDPKPDSPTNPSWIFSRQPSRPLTISESVRMFTVIERQPGFCDEVGTLVQVYLNKFRSACLENPADNLPIIELVDAVDCWASWKLADQVVLQHCYDAFTARTTEIKYSSNVGLWQLATVSAARLGFIHRPWLAEVVGYSKDPFMLDRISPWQLGSLLKGIEGLGLYEANLWKFVLSSVEPQMGGYRCIERLAEICGCAARVGHGAVVQPVPSALGAASIVRRSLRRIAEADSTNVWQPGNINRLGLTGVKSEGPSELLWASVVSGVHLEDTSIRTGLDLVIRMAIMCPNSHPRLLNESITTLHLETPDLLKPYENEPAVRRVRECLAGMPSGRRMEHPLAAGKAAAERVAAEVNKRRAKLSPPLPPVKVVGEALVISPKLFVVPVEGCLDVVTSGSRHHLTGPVLLRMRRSGAKLAVPAATSEDLQAIAELKGFTVESENSV